jgi:hypothetical protein
MENEIIKVIEPGFHVGLSNEDYHAHHASYSKTSLVDFSEYPAKMVFNRQNHERKTTFDLGTASHSAILEPEKYEDTVAVIPPSVLASNGAKNTNAYKEWLSEVPATKAVLKEDQRDAVLRIRDSVHDNPNHSEAHEYLSGGIAEVSCFWHERFRGETTDQETGYKRMEIDNYSDPGVMDDAENYHQIMLKVRPDYVVSDDIWSDLKTTGAPITRDKWQRQSENLHYHWSAALCRRGFRALTQKTLKEYIFVVVEVTPPHEVAVYRTSKDQFALGTLEVAIAMQGLAWCDKHNQWPGMPNKVMNLGLTGWSYNKLTNYKGDVL